MPKITTEGTYLVEIYGAHYIETNNGLCAVLPGKTTEGEWIQAYQTINEKMVSKGKNAGMSWAEITMQLLMSLGMSDDPNDIESLNGKQAQFVVELDTYNDKNTMKVRFVNTPGSAAASKDTVTNFFASMGMTSGSKEKLTDKNPLLSPKEEEDPDDIPF